MLEPRSGVPELYIQKRGWEKIKRTVYLYHNKDPRAVWDPRRRKKGKTDIQENDGKMKAEDAG